MIVIIIIYYCVQFIWKVVNRLIYLGSYLLWNDELRNSIAFLKKVELMTILYYCQNEILTFT